MYDLWEEHRDWLNPPPLFNRIHAIAGDNKTQNIFLISTAYPRLSECDDVALEQESVAKCKDILNDLMTRKASPHRVVNADDSILIMPDHGAIVQNPLLMKTKLF